MVLVGKLKFEAVSFDSLNFRFEGPDSQVENSEILAQKRILNFAAETFEMTVVVTYMNFSINSAIEVVDVLVEVL